jgi:hypothetical protein
MSRTWREPPGEWIGDADFAGFADHLDLAGIDDLCDRHGFAKARDLISQRLFERANGRPVVIDHMQEQH